MEKILLLILLILFCWAFLDDSEEKQTKVYVHPRLKCKVKIIIVDVNKSEVPEEVMKKAREALEQIGYEAHLYEVFDVSQWTAEDDTYWRIAFERRPLRPYLDGDNAVTVWVNKQQTDEIHMGVPPWIHWEWNESNQRFEKPPPRPVNTR